MLCAIFCRLSDVCRHVGTETGISKSILDLKIDRVSYKTRGKVTRVDVSMESSLACRDGLRRENQIDIFFYFQKISYLQIA